MGTTPVKKFLKNIFAYHLVKSLSLLTCSFKLAGCICEVSENMTKNPLMKDIAFMGGNCIISIFLQRPVSRFPQG